MKKIHKFSKTIALTLLLAIMVSFVPKVNTSASTVNLCKYIDKNFTWRSAPEGIYLDLEYDTISLGAICEGDTIDNLTCHIDDVTDSHPGVFSCTFDIAADGTVTTFSRSFAEGRYKIYFTGNADITKTFACIAFTKKDPLVDFVFPWP